jgi:hypothetical protein
MMADGVDFVEYDPLVSWLSEQGMPAFQGRLTAGLAGSMFSPKLGKEA